MVPPVTILYGNVHMAGVYVQHRSAKTTDIELMLLEGHSLSSIARWAGVSRARVSQIKRRVATPATPLPRQEHSPVLNEQPCNVAPVLKQLTLRLTPSVFDALTEACSITNRKDPDEPITIEDYVGELIINRVVELGLLRKNKRK